MAQIVKFLLGRTIVETVAELVHGSGDVERQQIPPVDYSEEGSPSTEIPAQPPVAEPTRKKNYDDYINLNQSASHDPGAFERRREARALKYHAQGGQPIAANYATTESNSSANFDVSLPSKFIASKLRDGPEGGSMRPKSRRTLVRGTTASHLSAHNNDGTLLEKGGATYESTSRGRKAKAERIARLTAANSARPTFAGQGYREWRLQSLA